MGLTRCRPALWGDAAWGRTRSARDRCPLSAPLRGGLGAGRGGARPAPLLRGEGAAERRAPSFKWTLLSLGVGSAGGSGRLAALAAAAAARSHLLPPPPRQVGCARCVRASTHPRNRSAAARWARRASVGCSGVRRSPAPFPGRVRGGGLQAGGQAAAAAAAPGDATALPRHSARHRADPAGSAALRSACCRCAGGVRAPRAFATLPRPLRLSIDVFAFVCALPPRSERQSGGRGSVKSFYAQNAEPSFHRRSEPQPNKSYFQEVECFIFFRLIFNVSMLSVCNAALDLQRRSAGLAPCFWLVGNGFEDLVIISVHVLSLLSCFRTRFDCVFNGDEWTLKKMRSGIDCGHQTPFRSQK